MKHKHRRHYWVCVQRSSTCCCFSMKMQLPNQTLRGSREPGRGRIGRWALFYERKNCVKNKNKNKNYKTGHVSKPRDQQEDDYRSFTNKLKDTLTLHLPIFLYPTLLPRNHTRHRQQNFQRPNTPPPPRLVKIKHNPYPGRNSQLTTLAVRRSKMMRWGKRSPHVKMWHSSEEMPA